MKNCFFSIFSFALLVVGTDALAQSFNGYALYNQQNSSTVYLIDKDANIAHTWSCNANGNYAVLLKEDGNIVRGSVYSGNQNSWNPAPAIGGMLQEYDPNGNVVWEFIYSNSQHVQHHDIEIMPNGNVLFIAWEVKTSAELTQAGYDGGNSDKWPTHIVEIQPSGSTANIVWEWHIWDHMVQDFDASKDNFGVVSDHPELMDINAISGGGGPGGGGGGGDWFHVNGINYNAELDQIVFTSRFASEFYIIDHSTTTAEAAGHTGGNSGMGGDFIYRWGNPSNYGAPGSQTIPGPVHDPRWIKDDGRINGGYIQFFNNDGNSGNSTVDAIDAPADGYNYTLVPGQSYGPSTYTWRHDCIDNANGQSASEKLSNGNTFVNLSGEYMYEVDSNDNVVWQHSVGPAKAFRYECTYPGIQILMGVDCNCDPGGTAYIDSCGACVGGNTGLSPCVNPTVLEETTTGGLVVFPNPSTGIFELGGLRKSGNYRVQVSDMYGHEVLTLSNESNIDLSGEAAGVYFIRVDVDNVQSFTQMISLIK